MSTALTTMGNLGEAIEAALMTGDLAKLSIPERMNYYNQVCKSLGLNPLTKPFSYIVLNGKLQMYATRDCTDQLRRVNGVSITGLDANQVGDLYIVVASAKDATGRTDQSTGAINILNLKGEALANALMKVETKAKRRVTLSLCGLGLLDETEIDTLRAEGIALDEGQEPPPVKHQVQMPKSTDEKKRPAQTQQRESKEADTSKTTQATTTGSTHGGNSAATDAVKISGEITEAKPGAGKAEGILFLIVETAEGEKLVSVPKELTTAEMVVKAKILLTATKRSTGKGDQYMTSEVEMVVSPEGEIIDAEFTEVDEKPQEKKPDPFVESMRGVFEEDAPKAAQATAGTTQPAAEATKPGTAGLKRGQRLHTLITQNHKNTGFTEDHLKKYLATQRLEHARDLACPPKGSDAFNAYEYACSMAVGEVDWHEILED